jgi:hypothetical protein
MGQQSVNPYANPFFESTLRSSNNGFQTNNLNLLKQPTPVNKLSYNAHTPTVGGL